MRIETLLEGITDIVFHSTSINGATRILESNRFILTPAFTKSAEVDLNPREKLFFLSTARTRTGAYHVNHQHGAVLIVLDGRKLSHNHHGRAIDYWGEDFRKARKGGYEEEDRIFSDEPIIDNATHYIKSIDIIETRWGDESFADYSVYREIYRMGTGMGVNVRIYDNKQDWLRGSDRTIDRQRLLEPDDEDIDLLMFLLTQEATEANVEQLKNNTNDTGLIRHISVQRRTGLVGAIDTLLHRISSISHSYLRGKVGRIGMEMRKKGLRTPVELSDYIIDKWVP